MTAAETRSASASVRANLDTGQGEPGPSRIDQLLDPGSATAHPTATQTFQALCLLARLHHIAAQPEALLHQLGISPREAASGSQLLQAAKLLGLKAKAVNSTANQLQQTPLPALAFMN